MLHLSEDSSFTYFRYKYRRDCVTHMKRKHSNTINGIFKEKHEETEDVPDHVSSFSSGSMSQYIQKIHSSTTPPPTLVQPIPSTVETKRYGCPYCSLMTKSTSSIYKHQTRKHASYPRIVHKYSSDDPTTRSIIAILKQKPLSSRSP